METTELKQNIQSLITAINDVETARVNRKEPDQVGTAFNSGQLFALRLVLSQLK
jgi:hypothetical protein